MTTNQEFKVLKTRRNYLQNKDFFYENNDSISDFLTKYNIWVLINNKTAKPTIQEKIIDYINDHPEYVCWTTLRYIPRDSFGFSSKEPLLFDSYSISTNGDVYSHLFNKILNKAIDAQSYLRSSINTYKKLFLSNHRLMLSSFSFDHIRLDGKTPSQLAANHKDSDRQNNKITNLEWSTDKENSRHRSLAQVKNGRGSRPISITLLKDVNALKAGSRYVVRNIYYLMDFGIERSSIHKKISSGEQLYDCLWEYCSTENNTLFKEPPVELIEHFKCCSEKAKSKPVELTLTKDIFSQTNLLLYKKGTTFHIEKRSEAMNYGLTPTCISSSIFSGRTYFDLHCKEIDHYDPKKKIPEYLIELFKFKTAKFEAIRREVGIRITLCKAIGTYKEGEIFSQSLKSLQLNKQQRLRIKTPALRGYNLKQCKIEVIEVNELTETDLIPFEIIKYLLY